MSQLNIFDVDIFHSFLSCLATIFDRKLQVFKKNRQNSPFLAFLK